MKTVIVNFDKELTAQDSRVVIAPPAGEIWTLERGSFVLEKAIPGTRVTVFEEAAPDAKDLRTNLIRVSSSENSWFPVVAGYTDHYVGGPPITLGHPHRLIIAMTGLTAAVKTYTRFTITRKP